ncbi:polysaccharide deacetylase family protein [Azospirillum doebereinerae]|uniref:polysaccharide deacetylase family protein n=1 Tax=Azospirillum doebereinerae TaxID=92933 RepID=UPI00163BE641|nr:polysaccharide deacetylase family protein [Azospirillum doebereinerae]MCG5238878.1 polysaccharide deacetylase family protein [Azospirillum doebereinerae]
MNRDRRWIEILSDALADGRPVSRVFGLDRGRPIDRYYIENFLSVHAPAIRGRVLEVGDATYTRRYGGERVTQADVLHATGDGTKDVIVSDLATGALEIASETYDCIILTQTLHFIHDMRAALEALRRILKPGGTLLATMAGITQISRYDMDRWGDQWRLTIRSAQELFDAVFIGDGVRIDRFGNSVAVTAFLNGLAIEDMPPGSLDPIDPDYEVTITAAVTKAQLPPKPRAGNPGRAVVLMYHRVALLESDPQLLAVNPERFREHMAALRSIGTPVPLSRIADGLRTGTLPERAIAVTFDDGYADNLHVAKPLLVDAEIPATVFVSTGTLGTAAEYWWDELERLILLPEHLPSTLHLKIGNGMIEADRIGTSPPERGGWNVLDKGSPTPRSALYRKLHACLLGLNEADERMQALLDLAHWSGCPLRGRDSHRPLDGDGVRSLAREGLIEIGAHTVSHLNLGRLGLAKQREEILRSQKHLASVVGRPIRAFAYPFGNSGSFDAGTVALLDKLGFTAAVTTRPDPVRDGDHPLLVPRLCVRDWPTEELVARIAAWLD